MKKSPVRNGTKVTFIDHCGRRIHTNWYGEHISLEFDEAIPVVTIDVTGPKEIEVQLHRDGLLEVALDWLTKRQRNERHTAEGVTPWGPPQPHDDGMLPFPDLRH